MVFGLLLHRDVEPRIAGESVLEAVEGLTRLEPGVDRLVGVSTPIDGLQHLDVAPDFRVLHGAAGGEDADHGPGVLAPALLGAELEAFELARRQQSDFGGIVSFEIKGGRQEAWTVIDATRLASITANLGDTKTTITHPASTTHGRLTQEERDDAGVRDSLIRVSVGLEEVIDIQNDLDQGLQALV